MRHVLSESRGAIPEKYRKIVDSIISFLPHLKVIFLSSLLYLVMLFFWFAYTHDVVTPDETLYYAWAAEWATGQYQVFRLYGDRTVFIFLTSIFFRLFGVNLAAGRWLVHLFGIGLMAVTYFLCREVYDSRVGILAMLILIFSGFFQFLSYFGLSDIPSTFFFVCTILFSLKAFKYKDKRYSAIGGLFFIIGPLTKITYVIVLPIVFIMWVKRVVKKELSLKEAMVIAGSYFILPVLAVVILSVTFIGMFMTSVRQGILPFAKEILDLEFLKERLQNLILESGYGWLGDPSHPTSFANLVKVLLFPGDYEGPWEQIYFQYYLVERWMWLVILILSLLFRRTRKFDMLTWIFTYAFVWLILTPAVGSLHVAEISDRYLYPIAPVIYIQLARLVILALDEIRVLQGKSVLDHLLGIPEGKNVTSLLFLLPMIPILWLIKPHLTNSSAIFICWVICLLIFFKVGKGKVSLTVSVASITVLFIILSNFLVQIQITDGFIPTPSYREPAWMFPPDMLYHEKIGAFEEGIWFWTSYSHIPPTRFTIKIFDESPEHFPGRFGGLYIWFSNSSEDGVTMYVRWTADYLSIRKFNGYFEGFGIKFTSLRIVNFEYTERLDLKAENYLTFQGEAQSTDHDGFNVDLEFLPHHQSYWIDWDLIVGRDAEHIFLGSVPLSEIIEGMETIQPPHRISFTTHALHLRWKGGSSLHNQQVFFKFDYQGLVVQSIHTKNFSHKLDRTKIYQHWGENGQFIPVQTYNIWSIFEETLKEFDLYLSYASWTRKQVEMDTLVHWNQTDPAYLHLGRERRDVPLKIYLSPPEEVHHWSISEGFQLFFKNFRPSSITSYFGFMTTIWIIALVPLIWSKRSTAPFEKGRKSRISTKHFYISCLTFAITEKIERNRLQLLFGWLFLGSLSLSLFAMHIRIVPFWWGFEGRMYFEGFLLQEARWLLFWRVFEELILAGTIIMGILFVVKDLIRIIRNQRSRSSVVKEKEVNLTQEALSGQPSSISTLTKKTLLQLKNARKRLLLRKMKKTQMKKTAASIALLSIVALTFVIVIRNDEQFMDQLTKNTRHYHDSLKKAYKFLEEYAEPDSGVMSYQPNFGEWYTSQKKLKFFKLDNDWSSSHIRETIRRREIEYVVISEWDDYHPYDKFDKYPETYAIMWSYAGTIGWRTVIYVTAYSDAFP